MPVDSQLLYAMYFAIVALPPQNWHSRLQHAPPGSTVPQGRLSAGCFALVLQNRVNVNGGPCLTCLFYKRSAITQQI